MGLDIQHLQSSFYISYERRAYQDYLILTCANPYEIKTYQLEMIKNNPHPGILTIEEYNRDNKVSFLYNITSKISLLKHIQQSEETAATIIKLYNSIISVLFESSNYLLKSSGFLIDENYLFIDPGTGKIALAYIPIDVTGDASIKTRELFIRFLKEDRFRIKPAELETVRILEEYLESGEVKGFISLSDFEISIDQLSKESLTNESKPYRLNEGAGNGQVSAKEITILSAIIKKREFYLFLFYQVLLASVLALMTPHLRLAAGNIITYCGFILIIGAIDLFIIKKTFADKTREPF